MLQLAGVVLMGLGLLCGTGLLVAPFGLLPTTPGLTLFLLFPGLLLVGYVLMVMSAPTPQIILISRTVSTLLMILGLLAVTALVMITMAILPPDEPTLTLWYVLVVGFAFGGIGTLTNRGKATS
ncbi:hypothetical protein HNQ59_002574 [Chitinivorax tropicus]|uniref:Uncharacterized protein n=1 Tax=Chitinivorax tropicus TaxID=714531 RepID=A0A840MS85_9PROT|nr:hypothetical protein [Chitinivorax tropicus]MBB5019276.1 hypothetical protein [Chitinivorax tropicus]